jgi:hypothetical protein
MNGILNNDFHMFSNIRNLCVAVGVTDDLIIQRDELLKKPRGIYFHYFLFFPFSKMSF